MKRIAILLGTLLISHIAVCEEPVTLKYAFNPEESVTIEVISICTLNQSEMKQFNKTKGKLVFDCRTEEANITENINGASRFLTVKSFSIENFKDNRLIALDDDLKKTYAETEQELLKQSARFRQTVYGYLTLHEKQEQGFSEYFSRNFKKYVAVPLPDHPVKPGDRWKTPYFKPFDKNSFTTGIDVDEYEYMGKENIDGIICAKIVGENFREDPSPPMIVRINPNSEKAKKIKDKRDYSKVSETVYFDIKKGRIVNREIKSEDVTYNDGKEVKQSVTEVVTYSYEDK